MNTPCETWIEPLSLLAADCLPPDEAEGVRLHAASCPACGERLRELQLLSDSLFAARPQVAAPTAAILGRLEEQLAGEAMDSRALPPVRSDAERAAWIAWGTALVAAVIFLGFAWITRLPPGEPPLGKQPPPERGIPKREVRPTEPILAVRERPTLLDYQRAARGSDDEIEALLRADSLQVSFGGPAPQYSFKPSLLESMP